MGDETSGISEMNKSFDDIMEVVKEKDVEEEVVVEPEVEEEEAEIEETTKEEMVIPEVEEEEEEDPPKELTEAEQLKEEIKTLRDKLAEKVVVKEPEPAAEPEPLKFDDQDFIGELDIEEMIREPGEFNKFLNKFYQQTVTDVRKILGEGILKSIPDIVSNTTALQTQLKEASDKFYEDNADLKSFKKVVAAVFEEIHSDNPAYTYKEVIKEVGPEVRKRLDLHKKAASKVEKEKNPRLPRKKGGSGNPSDSPDTNPLQDELTEMNKVVS